MKLGLAAMIAATGFALPAAAECLDETALSRGLTIRYEGGDYTTIRRTGGGYQLVDEYYSSGDPPYRYRAHRGIYFVEEFEPDANGRPVAGSRLVVEFEVDPATLPEPAAGVTWQGRTTNVFDDGTTRAEDVTIVFEAGPPLRVTGCDYQALSSRVRYDWGDEGALSLTYAYLPAIGTAVLLGSQFDGDDSLTFVPLALERASK